MCLILDKNRWGDFFQNTLDMQPIHQWLNKGKGKLVYSDYKQISEDGGPSKKMKVFIKKRSDAGQIKRIGLEKVTEAIDEINTEHSSLQSNDIHILGLAKASNTKLLCSNDQDLNEDFKKIITNGSIYKKQTHKHLLIKNVCP